MTRARKMAVIPAGIAMVLAVLLCPSAARGGDSRLAERVPEPIRIEVQAIVDSAAAESLPGEPLLQRALEGVTKGADGGRIVHAVRMLFSRLRVSRRVLGPRASPQDLVASAECLQVGADSTAIRKLRDAAPQGSLVVPLVVLADLVSRGAPVPLASRTTLALVEAGVSDEELMRMQMGFDRDILSGMDPLSSLSQRTRPLMPQDSPVVPECRVPGGR
jgi:hypothetical protein